MVEATLVLLRGAPRQVAKDTTETETVFSDLWVLDLTTFQVHPSRSRRRGPGSSSVCLRGMRLRGERGGPPVCAAASGRRSVGCYLPENNLLLSKGSRGWGVSGQTYALAARRPSSPSHPLLILRGAVAAAQRGGAGAGAAGVILHGAPPPPRSHVRRHHRPAGQGVQARKPRGGPLRP